MTTRFDNSMTAHVWAAQTQERGQSHNGNLYFEGRAIFSYGTHYCAGYVAGDGATRVYLTEAHGASVTTNGKHMPAVRRAVPGRGYPCPNLDSTRYELDRARLDKTAAQRVQRLAKHMESRLGIYWPGADSAAAIFGAMGASEAEATRRANAGQKRHDTAERKLAAKAARAELDSNAKEAKRLARYTPDESARWARDELGAAAGEARWQQERRVAKVKGESREAFRAAKAAKAKGWPRVAAAARAHYAAMRAELKRWETDCERYAIRAAVRNAIQSVRAFPDQQARAVASDMAPAGMARGYVQLHGYLLQLASCPYVDESGPFAQRLATEAGKARVIAEDWQRKANAARMAEQAEARAAWLAGGPLTYHGRRTRRGPIAGRRRPERRHRGHYWRNA